MFVIRPAITEDRVAIQRIYTAVVGHPAASNEAYWDKLLRVGGLLVAETDRKVIGFGGIDVNVSEQLKWIYLLPQNQGAGIGSQLLKRLENIGWEAGLNSLRVHSAPGAVMFYHSHGYSVVEEPTPAGHDHEGVEMIKERPTDAM